MRSNLRSPLESMRCGRHTAGLLLVASPSPSVHHCRYVVTTTARAHTTKRTVSNTDVSSHRVITI